MVETDSLGRQSIRLNGTWKQSSAWGRVTHDGGIELELYDYSDEAQSSMGNDVAWIWSVAPADKPLVVELLRQKIGGPVADDAAILEAFAQHFEHVHAVKNWLLENKIHLEEKFDSWA